MTAAEAIKHLSEYPPDEELIMGWWDQAFYNESWTDLTTEEWSNVVAHSESMDWSSVNESIDDLIEQHHIPVG